MKLVYSSAPADYTFREQLSAHLHSLVQQELLSEWHEQLIPAGTEAVKERRSAWLSADIILLLLSADYFSSNAYDDQEMQQALERHRSGQVIVVPILIRPCDWQSTVVAHLQCLPRNEIPVTLWENRDASLLSIAQELRHLITSRQSSGIPLTPVQRTNRQRLLKRVRTIWIEGLLEQSLQHAIWIDLHLQKQPDALERSWGLMVQELDRGPRPLLSRPMKICSFSASRDQERPLCSCISHARCWIALMAMKVVGCLSFSTFPPGHSNDFH